MCTHSLHRGDSHLCTIRRTDRVAIFLEAILFSCEMGSRYARPIFVVGTRVSRYLREESKVNRDPTRFWPIVHLRFIHRPRIFIQHVQRSFRIMYKKKILRNDLISLLISLSPSSCSFLLKRVRTFVVYLCIR